MAKRLADVLSGQEENYLLPFFWQHGEEEAVLREEMARVHEAGIRAVCVEARPHPDFYGPKWWQDIDVIMEEARARKIRVWLLDDDHFPTGHAAGKMAGAPPELRRLFLKEGHVDALGPQPGASFLVVPAGNLFELFNAGGAGSDALVAVVAARRDPASGRLTGERIDLTGCLQEEVLYWDVPEGHWRIFFIFSTQNGGWAPMKDYINVLDPRSVRVLIDAVYEPFYARYRDDFGQTFAGFFSDEPGFYNDNLGFDFASSVGKKNVALPWRADLLDRLSEKYGADFRTALPLLWHEGGEDTAGARFTYMDTVSALYAESFTQQIGDWCRERGVAYIGHVLEDNGVHARLGPGPAHYFRALWGQDMSGIDVVLWQLVPGFDEGPFANIAGDGDGVFYHYGLAKLGASLAHVDPKKQGRAMCELYGAYGWREGLKLMKWMSDHLLVRGINVFVPHAFSPKFPDPDCPPHLYARGQNPQYRYYHALNHYMNRAAHLLSGGVHVAPLAVLYHAEAEWAGEAMPFHLPVKALTQAQIDCDVLPADVLVDGAAVVDGALRVNAETYRALVIPACEALPARLVARLAALADQGLPVLCVDRAPARVTGGAAAPEELARRAKVVPLAELAGLARALGYAEIETSRPQPDLRYYHVRQPDMEVWMFTDEHPIRAVDTDLSLPGAGPALVYDPFTNRCIRLETVQEDGRLRFSLRLGPYQSLFVITGAGTAGCPAADPAPVLDREWTLPGPWSIATATAEQYPAFTPWQAAAPLGDLSRPGALPAFSGTFRYETTFDWPGPTGAAVLDLGEAYETVEVWLNGQPAGLRICPPYRLDVSGLLHAGKNTLVVEVTNTLVKAQRDLFSRYAAQEPSGLLGPAKIFYP